VNKMDRSGADFFDVVRQVHDVLGANPCPIQIPIGAEETFKGVVDLVKMKAILWHDETMGAEYEVDEIPAELQAEAEEWRAKMLESIAEFDDELMEKFFDDPSKITEEEIKRAIRKGTLSMKIYPMICGSSFKNKGVQTMLDAVCAYLPSPLDTEEVVGHDVRDAEVKITRKPSEEEPTCALAFKIATDPYVGRLCFFRVYSGKIDAGSYVFNTRSGKKERISRIFQMHSNKQNPVDFIAAGDIGAGVGFKDIRTGDTLCDEEHPMTLESIDFPDPVIGIAVEPKTQKDLDKLSNGLAKLAEEDPTFTVKTDEQTGQTIISGMGELHLEIIIDRLRREFKVECNQGRPQVSYKEAIKNTVDLREVYKKQSGGRGKFADMILKVGPADEGFEGDLQFIDEVKGGNIPKEFIPAIQKGFQTAMRNGVLAGYPVDKMKVVVVDGSFHPVDSDQISFEICAQIAFKNACAKAKPVLLEPIMKIEVVTPEENMGDVIGDLNKRRGQVEGMETSRTGARIVKAKVPLAEMFGYVTALRTITSGRATSSMEFSHYAEVSTSIAKTVLEEVKGHVELL
ncbi:MAG: elongation factor G, partial [Paludibacteraceae bacterium]|nr:elongation factor G [Paludibacteraceae bacterium]